MNKLEQIIAVANNKNIGIVMNPLKSS